MKGTWKKRGFAVYNVPSWTVHTSDSPKDVHKYGYKVLQIKNVSDYPLYVVYMYSRTLTNLTSPVQISECVSISKCVLNGSSCMVQLLFNAQQNTTCVWMSLFWVFTIVRSTVIIFSPHWGWWELRCDQWCSPPAAPHCHVLPSEYLIIGDVHHTHCLFTWWGEEVSSHVLVGFLLLTVPRPHKVQYRSQVTHTSMWLAPPVRVPILPLLPHECMCTDNQYCMKNKKESE